MPKELIWGDTVTVRRGDLDVLRARTRDDLAHLLDPASPPTDYPELDDLVARLRRDHSELSHEHRALQASHSALRLADHLLTAAYADLQQRHASLLLDRDRLRRRHRLLSQFVDVVRDADATGGAGGLGNVLRTGLRTLRAELDRVPLVTAGPTSPDRDGDGDDDLGADDPSHPDTYADPDPAFPRTEPADDRSPADRTAARTDPDEPHLCDGCGRTDRPVTATDDGRALVCASCRSQLAAALATDLTGTGRTAEDPAEDPAERAELEAERAAVARWAAIRDRPRRFRRDGEGDAPEPAGDPTDELVLQLYLQLGWERDGGTLQVGIKGHDHETGTTYDLGGHFLTLDWAQTNRATKKFRTARDQTWGAPE